MPQVALSMPRKAMQELGLGSQSSATQKEIKDAYRAQAKRYHPDVAGAQGDDADAAAAKFRDVHKAYEQLAAPGSGVGMSEAARRATRAPTAEEREAPVREYHATVTGAPIKVLMYMLLALTGAFSYDLAMKKRFPHQRGVSLRSLWQR